VDDAGRMGRLRCTGQFLHQLRRGVRRKRLTAQPFSETAPVTKLQREVGLAAALADLEHLHDVGVPQIRDRLGLGDERRRDCASAWAPASTIFSATSRFGMC